MPKYSYITFNRTSFKFGTKLQTLLRKIFRKVRPT